MSVKEVTFKSFADQKPGTSVATPLSPHLLKRIANNVPAPAWGRRSSFSNNLTTANPSSQVSYCQSQKVSLVASWSLAVMDDTGTPRSCNWSPKSALHMASRSSWSARMVFWVLLQLVMLSESAKPLVVFFWLPVTTLEVSLHLSNSDPNQLISSRTQERFWNQIQPCEWWSSTRISYE